jgi:hypothetical protein
MNKYFQLHYYHSRVETRIATYHLKRKATMRWDQLKQENHLDENKISWRRFKDISKRNISLSINMKGR